MCPITFSLPPSLPLYLSIYLSIHIWDFEIQTGHPTLDRRPDLVLFNKKNLNFVVSVGPIHEKKKKRKHRLIPGSCLGTKKKAVT